MAVILVTNNHAYHAKLTEFFLLQIREPGAGPPAADDAGLEAEWAEPLWGHGTRP